MALPAPLFRRASSNTSSQLVLSGRRWAPAFRSRGSSFPSDTPLALESSPLPAHLSLSSGELLPSRLSLFAIETDSLSNSVGLTFINSQFTADGTGMCKLDAAGDKIACPEAFGAFLGTASVVAIFAIALSFLPPRTIKKVFFTSPDAQLCCRCSVAPGDDFGVELSR